MAGEGDAERLVVLLEARIRDFEKNLQKASGTVDRTFAKMRKESGSATRQMEADMVRSTSRINQALASTSTQMGDVGRQFSTRLGPIGAGLGALGPIGIAAAAGIGILTLGLGSAIGRLAEAEKSTQRLEAVLRTTGYASGLTGGEIDKLASSMEKATGIAAGDVKEAATSLATFTTIGSENFKRTLKISEDLSNVFGGSLKQNVDRVARALDDPIEGFAALKKAGFSLADSELEIVKGMLRVGDVAGAQGIVLKNLENQISGASSAQSQGLSGAFDQAKGAVARFFEELANRSGIAPAAAAGLRGLAAAADDVTTSMQRSTFQKLNDDLAATLAQIEEIRNVDDTVMAPEVKFSAIETLTGKVDILKKKIEEGTAAEKAFQAGLGYEKLNAVYAERRAQAEASNDKFKSLITTQKEAIRATETNAEKLIRIRQEFDKTMTELANPAATVDPKLVAQARANAELIYKNQSDAVKKAMAAEQRASLKDDTRLDTFGRAKKRADEEIIALGREAEAVGLATRERDRLRVVIEMEAAAREANRAAGLKDIEVTTAQSEAIDSYAERVAAAMEKVREANDQYQEMQELQREFGSMAMTGIEGLIDGTKSLNDVLGDTLKRLAQMVIQAALLGDGPLAGMLGTKSSNGGAGGLIGSLAGMLGFDEGGYTGDGPRDQTAGIVHKGEYVFDKKSTERIGVPRLQALRGYASGGLVGAPSVPSRPAPASAPAASQGGDTLHFSPVTNITIEGSADEKTVKAMHAIVAQNTRQMWAELPTRWNRARINAQIPGIK